jgi:hypothetical protein
VVISPPLIILNNNEVSFMNDTLAIKKHREWNGKIEVISKAPVSTLEELSIAYTPGVAEACLAIKENKEESFNLTARNNMVAVITDGTAILGLGDIGPEAGMPVMEGKCALFKAYGDVNAVPICLDTKDTEEIIKTIKYLAPSFGGINSGEIGVPRISSNTSLIPGWTSASTFVISLLKVLVKVVLIEYIDIWSPLYVDQPRAISLKSPVPITRPFILFE